MEKKASTFFRKIDSKGFENHKSRVCEGSPLFLIKIYDEKGVSNESKGSVLVSQRIERGSKTFLGLLFLIVERKPSVFLLKREFQNLRSKNGVSLVTNFSSGYIVTFNGVSISCVEVGAINSKILGFIALVFILIL